MPTVEELLAIAETDVLEEQAEQYPEEVLEIDAKNKGNTDTRWRAIVWC